MNAVDWNRIIQIRDRITHLGNRLFIGLLTYTAPRRFLDYVDLFYYDYMPDNIDKHKNYVVLDEEPVFIFNRLEKQVVRIQSEVIVGLLREYIRESRIEVGKKIFPLSSTRKFAIKLERIFQKHGVQMNINLLKRAFVADVRKRGGLETDAERNKVARSMGYPGWSDLDFLE